MQAVLVAGCLVVTAVSGSAQWCPVSGCSNAPPPTPADRRQGHLVTIGSNVLIGSVSGATKAKLSGRPIWRGLVRGALGGAIIYGGKRIAAEEFSAAGLLGRQLSGLGTSLVVDDNVVIVPLGLGRVYLGDSAAGRWRFKVDLPATVLTTYWLLTSGTRLDMQRTLSNGAPVFIDRAKSLSAGSEGAGVIRIREDSPPNMRVAARHEDIHVLQSDFTFASWSRPLEKSLWAKSSSTGQRFGRLLDLRLDLVMLELLQAAIPYESRPWEREAHFLTRTRIREASALR